MITFGDEVWDEKDIEKVRGTIPFGYFKNLKRKKVLEMGCGVGWYVYLFSLQKNKASGIEIDKRRLDMARKNLKKMKVKARLVEGDIRDMPFKDGEFDAIFCHGVIEHFQDSENGIKEGVRVLKKGGLAMFSVPSKISFFVPLKHIQIMIDKIFGTKLWNCGYEQSFTPWKFKKMLKNEGLKINHFEISECEQGRRFPFIGKMLKILDKPFWLLGIGGRFNYAWCVKE